MSLGGDRPTTGRLGADRRPAAGKLGKTPERVGDRLESKIERKLKRLGARKQPGSGNYAGMPADIDIPEPETLLIESKEITGRRITPIELTSWLRKITREARASGRKKPCLVVGFPDMEGAVAKEWGMLPLDLLEKLILAAGWEGFE